jgi:hypothetical protein
MEERYSGVSDSDLSHCIEKHMKLLYPMDVVEVSTRWASSDSENPLEGKSGYVNKINYGLQSGFNRDYLIVGIVNGASEKYEAFDMWLYTLNLIKKDDTSGIREAISEQFGCLLYIDDRIKVIDKPFLNGKIGSIISMQSGPEKSLNLRVTHESITEQIKNKYKNLNNRVKQEFNKRNVKEGFDNFVEVLKNEEFEKYQLIEDMGKTRDVFEDVLRDEIFRELSTKSDFQTKLKELQDKAYFSVSSKNIELIERFPPNDLWKDS